MKLTVFFYVLCFLFFLQTALLKADNLYDEYHKQMDNDTFIKKGGSWEKIATELKSIKAMKRGTFEKTVLFKKRKQKIVSDLENKIRTAFEKSDVSYQVGIVKMISYDPDKEILSVNIDWQENVTKIIKDIRKYTSGTVKIPPDEAKAAFSRQETYPLFITVKWENEALYLENAYILKSKQIHFNSNLNKKDIKSYLLTKAKVTKQQHLIVNTAIKQKYPDDAKQLFSEDSIHSFLNFYFKKTEQTDINGIVSFYDNNVEYYDRGWVDKEYIRKDKGYYFRRWKTVENIIVGEIDIIDTEVKNEKLVGFYTQFFVQNLNYEKGKKQSSGIAKNYFWLKAIDGQLLIFRERQSIVEKH